MPRYLGSGRRERFGDDEVDGEEMDGKMTDDLIRGRGDNKTNEDGDADSSVTRPVQTNQRIQTSI